MTDKLATASTPFAAPLQATAPGSAGGMLRVVLALLLVLAAVLVCAWFARRVRGVGGTAKGIEVLSQVSLGARERAVLLRVAGRQVLVGVAPGNVRALHVIEPSVLDVSADSSPDTGAGSSQPVPSRPSFKAVLLRSLGK